MNSKESRYRRLSTSNWMRTGEQDPFFIAGFVNYTLNMRTQLAFGNSNHDLKIVWEDKRLRWRNLTWFRRLLQEIEGEEHEIGSRKSDPRAYSIEILPFFLVAMDWKTRVYERGVFDLPFSPSIPILWWETVEVTRWDR